MPNYNVPPGLPEFKKYRVEEIYTVDGFCPWCEETQELYLMQLDDNGTRYYVCRACLLPFTWTKPLGAVKDERLE